MTWEGRCRWVRRGEQRTLLPKREILSFFRGMVLQRKASRAHEGTVQGARDWVVVSDLTAPRSTTARAY